MIEHAPQPRAQRTLLVGPGEIDHHVVDMTATVAADVTLHSAQSRLAIEDQFLPIDGASSETISELVLRNSTGPLRCGYGAWRDNLLGAQFINGRSELITAGGRVLKNVAGYDLTKLLVGSLGCFGNVQNVTVRTYRRPAAALIAEFEPDPLIAARLLLRSLRPQWCILTHSRLMVGYIGTAEWIDIVDSAIVEENPRAFRRMSGDAEQRERESTWNFVGPGSIRYRLSVAPARLSEMLHQLPPHAYVADPIFGIVIGRLKPGELNAVLHSCRTMNAHIRWQSSDGRSFELVSDAGTSELLRRLKAAFDPDGVLSPLPEFVA